MAFRRRSLTSRLTRSLAPCSVTAPISRGTAQVVLTGPDEYVRSLQDLAKSKLGVDMDAHGLWSLPTASPAASDAADQVASEPPSGQDQATQQLRMLPSPDEGDVYNILDLPFVLPKDRVSSEVEAEPPSITALADSSNPSPSTSHNDHIIPLLRQRLALIQLMVAKRQETKARLAASDPERRSTRAERAADQLNAKRIMALESAIAALQAHPERVEDIEQARSIKEIPPNVLPRIERILKGEQVSVQQCRERARSRHLTVSPTSQTAPSLGETAAVVPSRSLDQEPSRPEDGLKATQVRQLASQFQALLPAGLELHALGAFRRGAVRIPKLIFCVCLPQQSETLPVRFSGLSGDWYGLNDAKSSKEARESASKTLKRLRRVTSSFFTELRTKHRLITIEGAEEVYQLRYGERFSFELQ